MTKIALVAVMLSALAVSACRREVPSYEPMKLGAGEQHTQNR